MINNFLFDWDGTIANSLPIWFKSWQETLDEFGVRMSTSELIDKVMSNWLIARELGIENEDIFYEVLYAKVEQKMVNVSLHDWVDETLRYLKNQGSKLAIVTSSRKKVIIHAMQKQQIDGLFDCVLGEEDYHKPKPNPEIIFLALSELKANPSETIIIGDSNSDMKAGQSAGIQTCWFNPNENRPYKKISTNSDVVPDFEISKFNQIRSFLENQNRI